MTNVWHSVSREDTLIDDSPLCVLTVSGLTFNVVWGEVLCNLVLGAKLWGGCRQPVTVAAIYRDETEVNAAKGGENLRLRLTGVEEEEMQPGFVICSRHAPVPCITYFDAQLQVRSCTAATSGPRHMKAVGHSCLT